MAEQNQTPTGEQKGASEQTGANSSSSSPANYPERLEKKVRRLEKENAALRKAEDDRKTAQLSEVEKLQKQVADLTGQLDTERSTAKTALMQARFEKLAATAGAQNPTSAYKLAKLDDVESADDDSGLENALKALQKSDPYLFGQPQAPPPNVGSSGGNPPNGNGKAAYTADQIAAMSPEDFAKADADLKAGRAILK